MYSSRVLRSRCRTARFEEHRQWRTTGLRRPSRALLSVVAEVQVPLQFWSAAMAQHDGSDAATGSNHASTQKLPHFPGEEFFAHAGSQWLEKAETVLVARGLLGVAQGLEPTSISDIVDVELPPELPPDHRDYERRLPAALRPLDGGE